MANYRNELLALREEKEKNEAKLKEIQEICPHNHVVTTFYIGQVNDGFLVARCLDCGRHGERREDAIYPGEDTMGNLKGKPTLSVSNEEFDKKYSGDNYQPLSPDQINRLGKFELPE